MRKFVLLCISLCYLWAAYGQDVIRYSYDNAGNRIKREIDLSRASEEKDDKNPESYSDRIEEHEIRIYPNPTKGDLVINISNIDTENQVTVILYNIEGKLMRRAEVNAGQAFMDIRDEQNGIYLMQINIDENSTIWKIFKE